jgi:hypothetical protein
LMRESGPHDTTWENVILSPRGLAIGTGVFSFLDSQCKRQRKKKL